MPTADPVVHLDPSSLADQMAQDVRQGLSQRPRSLPPKYFYDARGSELFDEITRLAEYYPTRTERSILEARCDDIAEVSKAETLIELGSGTSEKTRLLLRALTREGTLRKFVPFDVDPAVLKDASAAVAEEFPQLEVQPVVGDFERHLDDLPKEPPRLVAFLGSTIGNLDPGQRSRFLCDLRRGMGPGDALLLGTDLVKDPGRLVAAYDDSRGVTAAFNKNVLLVLNRDLGADFDPGSFRHRAVWVEEHEWIEMRLESLQDQEVRVDSLDLEVSLERGEEIRTEISTKFRREGVGSELRAAGLRMTKWWTDPDEDFALSLSVPD